MRNPPIVMHRRGLCNWKLAVSVGWLRLPITDQRSPITDSPGSLQRTPDRLRYCLDLLKYFRVPESHHSVTSRLEVLRALSVVLVAQAMLTSVQLDDEVSFDATEVGDVRADRMLAEQSAARRPRRHAARLGLGQKAGG